MDKKTFGKLADGDKAALYTIENENGMKAEITDYGAALVSLTVKDKTGKDTDVVLGYDSAEEYERQFANFGAIVGRNCNRIKDARIVIDGVTYELEKNDHENSIDHCRK